MKKTDVAILRLSPETSPEQFQRFIGAITAAHRMGAAITLRIVNNPTSRPAVPLDIYAEAHHE